MTPGGPRGDPYGLQGCPAGLVSRAVAAVVDAVAVLGIGLAALLTAGVVRFAAFGPPFGIPALPRHLTTACGAVLAVAYLTAAWSTAGRTAGSLVMGLRVTGRTGAPVGLGRALLRAVLCVFLPLGLLWIPFGRRRASVQDVLTATRVVHDWHRGPPGPPPPRRGPGTSITH